MEITKSILKGFDGTYFSENGSLKRNKVIEDLDAYTPTLMKALLSNKIIHDTYTESLVVDDKSVDVFKLNQFIEMFTYKEYWQDSYTKFENKIGLTAGGKFIDETADVVLDFPFKDTVLKAGMKKEDQKEADEPFLHETIAKAEIDQLLEPKIFVNATKYDKEHIDGEKVDDFDDDNLVIKGNNLLALYSLKERYAGKIKLIYLDVPYNTGKDSFIYNDRFSHSTWLTFIKNRIEISKSLLTNDGSIWINIDDNESHYLKVLMDSIFGRDNFVSNIIWQKKYTISNDAKWFSDNHDNILVYAKIKNNFEVNGLPRTNEMNSRYKNPDGDINGPWITSPLHAKSGNVSNFTFTFENGVTWTPPRDTYPRYSKETLRSLDKNNKIWFGTDGKAVPRVKKYLKDMGSVTPGTIWLQEHFGNNDQANREVKELVKEDNFSTPKPEKLIQRILTIGSNKGDIVLDFFMGSATTQAVAMKMKRQFIGIEQMDYINKVSVPRLQKVIDGEQGGISKDANWQGGSSFVYAELMEKNQDYLSDIQHAETTKQLEEVVNRMIMDGADFDFRVDVEKVLQDTEYQAMSWDDKKQMIVKVIDKNQLYYTYSDMEDCEVQDLMSESDIAFNKSFYRGV